MTSCVYTCDVVQGPEAEHAAARARPTRLRRAARAVSTSVGVCACACVCVCAETAAVCAQGPVGQRDRGAGRRVAARAAAPARPAAGAQPPAPRAGRRLHAHARPASAVSTSHCPLPSHSPGPWQQHILSAPAHLSEPAAALPLHLSAPRLATDTVLFCDLCTFYGIKAYIIYSPQVSSIRSR